MYQVIRQALARRLAEFGLIVKIKTEQSSRRVKEPDPDKPGAQRWVDKTHTWQEEQVWWDLFRQGSGCAFDATISQDAILADYLRRGEWTEWVQLVWCVKQGLDLSAAIKHDGHYCHANSMNVEFGFEDAHIDPDAIDGPVKVTEEEHEVLMQDVSTRIHALVEEASTACYDALYDYYTRTLRNDKPRERTQGGITLMVEPTQEGRGSDSDLYSEVLNFEEVDFAFNVLFDDEYKFAPYRFRLYLIDDDGDKVEVDEDEIEEIGLDYFGQLHSQAGLEETIEEWFTAAFAHFASQQQPAAAEVFQQAA